MDQREERERKSLHLNLLCQTQCYFPPFLIQTVNISTRTPVCINLTVQLKMCSLVLELWKEWWWVNTSFGPIRLTSTWSFERLSANIMVTAGSSGHNSDNEQGQKSNRIYNYLLPQTAFKAISWIIHLSNLGFCWSVRVRAHRVLKLRPKQHFSAVGQALGYIGEEKLTSITLEGKKEG